VVARLEERKELENGMLQYRHLWRGDVWDLLSRGCGWLLFWVCLEGRSLCLGGGKVVVSRFWLLLGDYMRGSFLFVYGVGWSICCGGWWGCGIALSVELP